MDIEIVRTNKYFIQNVAKVGETRSLYFIQKFLKNDVIDLVISTKIFESIEDKVIELYGELAAGQSIEIPENPFEQIEVLSIRMNFKNKNGKK